MSIQNTSRKRSVQDFKFESRIGEGSYSTVFKATDVQNKKPYAIKVLSKKHIVKEKKIKYVNIEKTTLNRLGRHPGIVTLYYTFQDDASLYFVIDIAEYGELLSIIRKLGSLSEDCSKFYLKQIIDAVDFMHSKGIIHRDLKPENILVNKDMNLMITDFGAAKILDLDTQGQIIENSSTEESLDKGSFVGTAEYVSPELLKFNKCGLECDYWAIGCILYQFIVGVPPFKGKTEFLTFEKIVNLQYQWPNFYIPSTIKNLVENLLKLEPKERLSMNQIKSHNWFGNFNWDDKNAIWVQKPPKLEPYQSIIQQHNENTTNFKKIMIQKKLPTATAKQQLLNNTLKQIKNENGSYIYTPAGQKNIPKNIYKPVPQVSQVPPQFSPQKKTPNSPGYIQQRSNSQPLIPKIPHVPQAQSPQQMISKVPPVQQAQSPIQPFRPQHPQHSAPHIPQVPQVSQVPQQHVPTYIQNIHDQATIQTRNSSAPSPKLQPALVPTAPQIKPQYITAPSTAPKFHTQPPPIVSSQSPRSSPRSIANSPNGSSPKSATLPPPRILTQSPRRSPRSTSSPNTPNGSSANSSTTLTSNNVNSSPNSPPKKKIKVPLVISNELSNDENIIKLDYVYQSELIYSSLYTMDPTSPLYGLNSNSGLDDVLINEIITRNESNLEAQTKRIIMIITDYGNLYLFNNESILNFEKILKIDLTNKCFAMYDYEFNESKESGYLILELSKIDKLIFLSPLPKSVKSDLNDISSIQIGDEYSWIEALLKTKELLKSKPSSPAITNNSLSNTSMTRSSPLPSSNNFPLPPPPPQQKLNPIRKTSSATPTKQTNGDLNDGTKTMNKTTSKPPQAKLPKRPTSQTTTPTTTKPVTEQQKIQQQNKKFAGSGAAAAFNASR